MRAVLRLAYPHTWELTEHRMSITEQEFYASHGELMERLATLQHMENSLMSTKMDTTLRCAIEDFERRYDGLRPICVLACRGFSDEHWQLFHPKDMEHPVFTVDNDGTGYEHHEYKI